MFPPIQNGFEREGLFAQYAHNVPGEHSDLPPSTPAMPLWTSSGGTGMLDSLVLWMDTQKQFLAVSEDRPPAEREVSAISSHTVFTQLPPTVSICMTDVRSTESNTGSAVSPALLAHTSAGLPVF